jgi:hypothetical protein
LAIGCRHPDKGSLSAEKFLAIGKRRFGAGAFASKARIFFTELLSADQ